MQSSVNPKVKSFIEDSLNYAASAYSSPHWSFSMMGAMIYQAPLDLKSQVAYEGLVIRSGVLEAPTTSLDLIKIDGGKYTNTISANSDQFILKKTVEGDGFLYFDEQGRHLSGHDSSVGYLKFSDKTIDLSSIPKGALVSGSDVPAFADAKEIKLETAEAHLEAWMERPQNFDFPTMAIVNLVAGRVWNKELTDQEWQNWEEFVFDYVQDPKQEAQLTGLIKEYTGILIT